MNQCQKCQGFLPKSALTCPNCGLGLKRKKRPITTAAALGLVSMTLMACYGGPPDFEAVDHPKEKKAVDHLKEKNDGKK